MPSNSDNIDNQGALASEGVEVCPTCGALPCDQVNRPAKPLTDAEEQILRLSFVSACREEDYDSALAITATLSLPRTLPSTLAGDDRNGVEVTDAMLNAGQERLCEIRSVTNFDDEAQAEIFKAMYAALRTPSSPQADDEARELTAAERTAIHRALLASGKVVARLPRTQADVADVERHKLLERLRGTYDRGKQIGANTMPILLESELGAVIRLLATMTTRPAGGEEVEKLVRKVCDEVSASYAEPTERDYGAQDACITVAKSLVAALTSPQATEEGV